MQTEPVCGENPAWWRAESPRHLPEREYKARPPQPERDSRPGVTGEDRLRRMRTTALEEPGGRLRGASGAIPDAWKSTGNFERPLHICLPNAVGFPGHGRSREMQTSKFRLGLKMRIECSFF